MTKRETWHSILTELYFGNQELALEEFVDSIVCKNDDDCDRMDKQKKRFKIVLSKGYLFFEMDKYNLIDPIQCLEELVQKDQQDYVSIKLIERINAVAHYLRKD